MSGGAAVTGRNAPEWVRAGERTNGTGDYTAGAFRPKDTALTAQGLQAPARAQARKKDKLGRSPRYGERPFAKDPDRQVRHRRTSVRHDQVSECCR